MSQSTIDFLIFLLTGHTVTRDTQVKVIDNVAVFLEVTDYGVFGRRVATDSIDQRRRQDDITTAPMVR